MLRYNLNPGSCHHIKITCTCLVIEEEGHISVSGQKIFVQSKCNYSITNRRFTSGHKFETGHEINYLLVNGDLKFVLQDALNQAFLLSVNCVI